MAVKTIGEDELHIIKSPFSVNALKWDAMVVGATGILIANDESVLHQVPASWHNTSINISNAGVYGLGATAGGIFVTGLITHNQRATDTGIRSAEASVDSVILYAALKAILARQRPYTGAGEGKFFSGNWTAGSFPSGHATLAWTLATVDGARISELADAPADVRRSNCRQHYPRDRRRTLPVRRVRWLSDWIWGGNLRRAQGPANHAHCHRRAPRAISKSGKIRFARGLAESRTPGRTVRDIL